MFNESNYTWGLIEALNLSGNQGRDPFVETGFGFESETGFSYCFGMQPRLREADNFDPASFYGFIK